MYPWLNASFGWWSGAGIAECGSGLNEIPRVFVPVYGRDPAFLQAPVTKHHHMIYISIQVTTRNRGNGCARSAIRVSLRRRRSGTDLICNNT